MVLSPSSHANGQATLCSTMATVCHSWLGLAEFNCEAHAHMHVPVRVHARLHIHTDTKAMRTVAYHHCHLSLAAARVKPHRRSHRRNLREGSHCECHSESSLQA